MTAKKLLDWASVCLSEVAVDSMTARVEGCTGKILPEAGFRTSPLATETVEMVSSGRDAVTTSGTAEDAAVVVVAVGGVIFVADVVTLQICDDVATVVTDAVVIATNKATDPESPMSHFSAGSAEISGGNDCLKTEGTPFAEVTAGS